MKHSRRGQRARVKCKILQSKARDTVWGILFKIYQLDDTRIWKCLIEYDWKYSLRLFSDPNIYLFMCLILVVFKNLSLKKQHPGKPPTIRRLLTRSPHLRTERKLAWAELTATALFRDPSGTAWARYARLRTSFWLTVGEQRKHALFTVDWLSHKT